MKGKALRKHSLYEKTAASILLKLFISGNEWCHTTDAPKRMSRTPFSNVNNIHVHSMIPEDQKNARTDRRTDGQTDRRTPYHNTSEVSLRAYKKETTQLYYNVNWSLIYKRHKRYSTNWQESGVYMCDKVKQWLCAAVMAYRRLPVRGFSGIKRDKQDVCSYNSQKISACPKYALAWVRV